MPRILKKTTMTANGQAFPLSGSQYEYLPFAAMLQFAVLGDTGASVTATIYAGSDVLQQNADVDILAVASPIIFPDHYNVQDTALAGERQSVELIETGGATPVVRTSVIIQPL